MLSDVEIGSDHVVREGQERHAQYIVMCMESDSTYLEVLSIPLTFE